VFALDVVVIIAVRIKNTRRSISSQVYTERNFTKFLS
jgi:hypothetical protein